MFAYTYIYIDRRYRYFKIKSLLENTLHYYRYITETEEKNCTLFTETG